jgi:UDP-N-acetyl-D-glucosamine dehydrogenase
MPFSLEQHRLAEDHHDASHEQFLLKMEKVRTKQVVIGVIGLGYVGLPLSLVFAEENVRVIGFDVDQKKIQDIEKGKSYIQHIHDERLQKAVTAEKFFATGDMSFIAECDAVIICVPTPLSHHLEPDLTYIVKTSEAIAPYLQPHTLVSLESTTWPGTTEEVVLPILEQNGKLKLGENLYLSFSPEREDPGNKAYGTKTIPKLVGGAEPRSLEFAKAIYQLGINEIVPLSTTRVAEAAKLLENIFRSVNIALVNELKMIFDKMDIDVWEVIRAAGTKPFGYMPFWPGPGLGGHCIPIDPFYLTWKAKEFGIQTRFIELAGEINRCMPRWVVGKVQDCLNNVSKPLKGSRILILGLTYKADVADTRESPSLELMTLLEEKGALVDYHDPYIEEIPSTREYGKLRGRRSQRITHQYDCFLLSTAHKSYSPKEILALGVPIVDTRNFFPKHDLVFNA